MGFWTLTEHQEKVVSFVSGKDGIRVRRKSCMLMRACSAICRVLNVTFAIRDPNGMGQTLSFIMKELNVAECEGLARETRSMQPLSRLSGPKYTYHSSTHYATVDYCLLDCWASHMVDTPLTITL